MADSILREKAKQFAKDIVFLCREIKSSHKEAVLANQLLRSATSVGANIHEAQYAQSKNVTGTICNTVSSISPISTKVGKRNISSRTF